MLTTVLALLLGLLIGSFLNVCIHRMPRDLSVVRPRSYCPVCEKPIAWYDNVPLVSYVMLGGCCRACKARISWRYPLVELLTGLIFATAVAQLGLTPEALKACLFGALLVGLAFSDLEERILPDEFTIGGALAGVLLSIWVPLKVGYVHFLFVSKFNDRWLSVLESLVGALVAGGLMWAVGAAYAAVRHREGLGLGDVKMVAMIGAFLGLTGALQALVTGSIAGSVIGLAYIKIAKKDASTYELPFGTFIAAAALALSFALGPLPQ
jgi:leader peptidase (prepilin peptidase)/N-methyltransferase